MNSIICPTYKMSYDHVMELLSLSVEEEKELYLLAEAALVRGRWRKLQVWLSNVWYVFCQPLIARVGCQQVPQ